MPTYEYHCSGCDTKFEAFHSMSAEPVKDCPTENCEGLVKRLMSGGAGLIFKGSGFYITDYRDDSYSEAAKKDKDNGKSDSGKSDNGKSDSGKSDSGKSDSGKSDSGKSDSSKSDSSKSDSSKSSAE